MNRSLSLMRSGCSRLDYFNVTANDDGEAAMGATDRHQGVGR